ncbi:replication initiation protein [Myroides odoratimimus]|uniref:replication initiation protein n=2 Tax=Myroides TaxID=76831 RepID=UPI00257834B3|nr:replication initiation protein [Myroides odoratimimus]MDM1497105.1 replication initiation protein [Myroides odoratimimus]MDM1500503.1 replication initiation protein [Myroides odoratimimus]
MAVINNKELFQSYILTTAKYDFSVHEKRILYRIIELNQHLIEGKKLNRKYKVDSNLLGDSIYTLPISLFLKEGDSSNHLEVKKALNRLQKKEIVYEDDTIWASLTIIANPKIQKFGETVTFTVDKLINDALLDFSKGYRKYELKTAMEFESVYSMRFYELFSSQAKPINYSIDTLKEMFGIVGKYKLTADFIRRVVEPAKKELDEKSPYTFIYKELKTGRKITSLQFIPIYQASKEDAVLKSKQIGQKISTGFYLDATDKEYLIAQYGFTDKEIKNNSDLFEKLYKELEQGELIDKLSELRRKAGESHNPKGYVIASLRQFLEDKDTARAEQLNRNIKQQQEQRAKETQSLDDVLKAFK